MANDTFTGNLPSASALAPPSPAPVGARRLTREVERTLAEFLTVEVAMLDSVDPVLGGFGRTARDAVLAGGKRLRPLFAYWGWRGLVGEHDDLRPVLPALAALELMHAFALLHDDVMDASATRRGRPTAHRVFAGQHRRDARRGDSGHFGDAAAVLAGDLCLVWADQLLARADLPAATLLAARAGYDRMRVEAVAGQYLDIHGESDPAGWTVERALLVARHKTASYTVQRPLHFGAALADRRICCGGSCHGQRHAAVNAAYSRYGLAVGEAFQLRDDLLGAFGDPAVTGKPAGDDLRTGKPTVLLMYARELAGPAQRAALDSGDATLIADVIAGTGADRKVEDLIHRRVGEAVDTVNRAPVDDDARTALTDLAVSAAHRPS